MIKYVVTLVCLVLTLGFSFESAAGVNAIFHSAGDKYVGASLEYTQAYEDFGGYATIANSENGQVVAVGANYTIQDTWTIYTGFTQLKYNSNELSHYTYKKYPLPENPNNYIKVPVYNNTSYNTNGVDFGIRKELDKVLLGIGYNTSVNKLYASIGIKF